MSVRHPETCDRWDVFEIELDGPAEGNPFTDVELLRRCWEGAVRGGYVQHGETYLNEAEELWWSKGGRLTGTTPERVAERASGRVRVDQPARQYMAIRLTRESTAP